MRLIPLRSAMHGQGRFWQVLQRRSSRSSDLGIFRKDRLGNSQDVELQFGGSQMQH